MAAAYDAFVKPVLHLPAINRVTVRLFIDCKATPAVLASHGSILPRFVPSLNKPFRRDYPGRGRTRGMSSGNFVRRAFRSH